MQVHKCTAYKHLSITSLRLKHIWIYCIASVCTIWKVVFALLLSPLWCVTLHQSFSLISTWQLCYMVLLFRQLFLLGYLLYRQFHLHLFLSLPQFIPFTACYLIWTSFCFTLPCLSVLDGDSFTHHNIHIQAIVKPSGIYIEATVELCSPRRLPTYTRKHVAEPDRFWRRTVGMMKGWDSSHAQNDDAGKWVGSCKVTKCCNEKVDRWRYCSKKCSSEIYTFRTDTGVTFCFLNAFHES